MYCVQYFYSHSDFSMVAVCIILIYFISFFWFWPMWICLLYRGCSWISFSYYPIWRFLLFNMVVYSIHSMLLLTQMDLLLWFSYIYVCIIYMWIYIYIYIHTHTHIPHLFCVSVNLYSSFIAFFVLTKIFLLWENSDYWFNLLTNNWYIQYFIFFFWFCLGRIYIPRIELKT